MKTWLNLQFCQTLTMLNVSIVNKSLNFHFIGADGIQTQIYSDVEIVYRKLLMKKENIILINKIAYCLMAMSIELH